MSEAGSIVYKTDGEEHWVKIVGKAQCANEDVFEYRCQGVKGHQGCHWAYQPNGSYHYWKNEEDPDAIEKDIACGTTPPDHASYVHPLEKQKEYYSSFYTVEDVTDANLIAMLEADEAPEEHASIDRPLPPDEVGKLIRDGVLEGD